MRVYNHIKNILPVTTVEEYEKQMRLRREYFRKKREIFRKHNLNTTVKWLLYEELGDTPLRPVLLDNTEGPVYVSASGKSGTFQWNERKHQLIQQFDAMQFVDWDISVDTIGYTIRLTNHRRAKRKTIDITPEGTIWRN